MNIKETLARFLETHGIKHWNRAATKDDEFMKAVYGATADMSEDTPFAERVYCASTGERPHCERGGKRKLKSLSAGWAYCGRAGVCPCAAASVSIKCKTNIDHDARLAKTRQTLEERYGTTNPAMLPQAKEAHQRFYEDKERVAKAVAKGRATMIEKYGVDNAFKMEIDRLSIAQRNFSEETCRILNDRQLFEEFVRDKSSQSAAELLGVNYTTINNYLHHYDITPKYNSSFEKEIAAFLEDNALAFKARDRSIIRPKELDFYLPDHKLGIEFNGLYYHSCQVLDDRAHYAKWTAAHEAGITLLMINEDEWVERPEVLKRKILNLCGKSERGPGARKLVIKPLTNTAALEFVARNHIQGAPSTCVFAYGAYSEERLVGVLTFGRQRGTRILELTRFCSDGRVYAGMFSKLLKAALCDISEDIVTFADLRYSEGNLYERCGFEKRETIRPDYKYVKRNKTYHKSLFTKRRIEKKFGVDMSLLTEREAMRQQGYSRIYDCGKIRYVLPNKNGGEP